MNNTFFVTTRYFGDMGIDKTAVYFIPKVLLIFLKTIAVRDVAEALRRCLDLTQSVTMNMSGPHKLTLREVGECIGRVLGVPAKFSVHSEQPVPVIVGEMDMMKKLYAGFLRCLLNRGCECGLCHHSNLFRGSVDE